MPLPLNFKVKKTVTPFEQAHIAKTISHVEGILGKKLLPTDDLFHLFYFVEAEWKQYQEIYQFIKKESLDKPYILID